VSPIQTTQTHKPKLESLEGANEMWRANVLTTLLLNRYLETLSLVVENENIIVAVEIDLCEKREYKIVH
jgi:hypothetical protein